LIRAGVEGEVLYLEFADNGDGIPEHNKEQIFEAFFTTSAPAAALASDSDQLIGTGLGLKIVKDVLEGADGEIYLTTPPLGFNTCFRVEVPKAKKEDIPNDAY
jgi:signal transduction histidine kinase